MRYQKVIGLVGTIATAINLEGATLSFDQARLSVSADGRSIQYPGATPVVVGDGLSVPVLRFCIALSPQEQTAPITARVIASEPIPFRISDADLRDTKTSLAAAYPTAAAGSALLGSPVQSLGFRNLQGNINREISISLVQRDSVGACRFVTALEITVGTRLVGGDDCRPCASHLSIRDHVFSPALPTPSSTSPDYLIVTSQDRVTDWQSLAHYRRQTGFGVALMAVEDILQSEQGRDDAEKLRTYLQRFASEGGRFVLLAGDESNLPVRYAHEFDVNGDVPRDKQHLCDMYFADLTGDWNADDDLVWGEPGQDAPDLTPELLVGRVPLTDRADIAAYIARLVTHETDPGKGDETYLTRTLFVSSDQMRDSPSGGQHGIIARAFPSWFAIDTISAVEQRSGDDPLPSGVSGKEAESAMRTGFGIIQVLAHGRHDGFAVRTSGYNNAPKSYLWTGLDDADHGLLGRIAAVGKPSFVYSLACETAGFDTERAPFNYGNRHMAEELLGMAGGAVGIVGYSRWGWVNLSYRLQKSFFDSLFAHPDDPAAMAMYRAQAAYPWYRDLLYSQMFLGDPALRVYTRRPDRLQIDVTMVSDGLSALITRDGAPVANLPVTLTDTGSVLRSGDTDAKGEVQFAFESLTGCTYTLTAQAEGSCVAQASVRYGIATDADDPPGGGLPEQVELYPNYPNPFNPSTTIAFALPYRMPVSLTIYNLLGQQVETLISGELPAGIHEIRWDARQDRQTDVSSGLYFARLQTSVATQVRKLLLVR